MTKTKTKRAWKISPSPKIHEIAQAITKCMLGENDKEPIGSIKLVYTYDTNLAKITIRLGDQTVPEIDLLDISGDQSDIRVQKLIESTKSFSRDELIEAVSTPLVWDCPVILSSHEEHCAFEYSFGNKNFASEAITEIANIAAIL